MEKMIGSSTDQIERLELISLHSDFLMSLLAYPPPLTTPAGYNVGEWRKR